MKAQPKGSHFVNGRYVDDKNGKEIEVRFSATNEVIAVLHSATEKIIEEAISSAEAAQKEWAAWRPVARGRVLHKAAEIIRARNQELSELETLDTGKPIQETIIADASSGADAIEFFAGLAQTINGEMVSFGSDWAYTKRVPLGVCLGIGAWNYPIQIASWKSAPALASGNSMIFKPSELTPLSALKLAEIYLEAGAPAGLFNVVQGFGDVGGALVNDLRIAKVSLTGSVPTGQRVYAEAAKQMKHVTMELGGKSPLIIFEDADIENAISGILIANFYSTGQVCSNGTRVYVHKSIYDRLVSRLVERVKAIKIGDPRIEETQMGPMASLRQREIVLGFIEKGKAEGAKLECGGEILTLPGLEEGAFISPAVFSNVKDEMTIAREEIFGPVASILSFDGEDEVIKRANDTVFGLSAGIYTDDLRRAHRVIDHLHAGTCWINAYNLTPVEVPFGGSKLSGVGRENGRAAIEHYTELKTIYVGMEKLDLGY